MISCQKGSNWCYRQKEEQLRSGNGYFFPLFFLKNLKQSLQFVLSVTKFYFLEMKNEKGISFLTKRGLNFYHKVEFYEFLHG